MRSKKTPRQLLVKKADDLTRSLVRGRGYCEMAGKDRIRCGGVLQWCHIIGRSNYRLRWELWNALCMCAGHHVYYTHHPLEWFEIIPEKFPDNWGLISAHRNEMFDKNIDKYIDKYEELLNG